MFRVATAVFLVCFSQAQAQSISLEDLEAKVNERASTLAGYEAYLRDPDPNRAMAAFQIMLESGDPTLVQLAMSIGVYSPDANIRQTALKSYFTGKPTVDLQLDGSALEELHIDDFRKWAEAYGGSIGAENSADLSFKASDWNDEMGCYMSTRYKDYCLLRVNATTVSVQLIPSNKNYAPTQWITLTLGDQGAMVGTLNSRWYNTPLGPFIVTMGLAE